MSMRNAAEMTLHLQQQKPVGATCQGCWLQGPYKVISGKMPHQYSKCHYIIISMALEIKNNSDYIRMKQSDPLDLRWDFVFYICSTCDKHGSTLNYQPLSRNKTAHVNLVAAFQSQPGQEGQLRWGRACVAAGCLLQCSGNTHSPSLTSRFSSLMSDSQISRQQAQAPAQHTHTCWPYSSTAGLLVIWYSGFLWKTLS